jgi:hypothetical protein
MEDENGNIDSIKESLGTLLRDVKDSQVNNPDTVAKISFLEKVLSKILFNLGHGDFEMYNLLKLYSTQSREKQEPEYFNCLKSFFEYISKEFENDAMPKALNFYSLLLKALLAYPSKFDINSKRTALYNQGRDEDRLEELLAHHVKDNFFPMADQDKKKYDNNYFNENYVKSITDKLNYKYSVNCIKVLFDAIRTFELQTLQCKDLEHIKDMEEGHILAEKNLIKFLDKSDKEIISCPKNFVDYFIECCVNKITHELYKSDSKFNNYEIENSICFCLFIIQKLIQDYSFYFERRPNELEKIFLALKKYKE